MILKVQDAHGWTHFEDVQQVIRLGWLNDLVEGVTLPNGREISGIPRTAEEVNAGQNDLSANVAQMSLRLAEFTGVEVVFVDLDFSIEGDDTPVLFLMVIPTYGDRQLRAFQPNGVWLMNDRGDTVDSLL